MSRVVLWWVCFLFTAMPAFGLLVVGAWVSHDGDVMVDRVRAARAGPERVVSGKVSLREGTSPLRAPGSNTSCVAWETRISAEYSDRMGDENVDRSLEVRSGGAALPFDLVSDDGGIAASFDQPRLDLKTPPRVTRSRQLPAWTGELTDSPRFEAPKDINHYEASERLLAVGDTVTVFGVPGAPPNTLTPAAGGGPLLVTPGTPEAIEKNNAFEASIGRWLMRIAAGLGVLALLFGIGLVRAVFRARA